MRLNTQLFLQKLQYRCGLHYDTPYDSPHKISQKITVTGMTENPNHTLFSEFWNKIEKYFGLKYSGPRYSTIAAQVLERSISAGCASSTEYLQRFISDSFNAKEYEYWANVLTVNETYFMRNAGDWKALKNTILPMIIQNRRSSRTIKIVSIGCASGEEIYSMALSIAQWFPELLDWKLLLIGGDIDTSLLEIAREGGPYSQRSIRLIDPKTRDEYLYQKDDRWFVRESLKTYTDFRYFNILKTVDPVLTQQVDILFCRNVLIYFDTSTAIQCVKKCINYLAPDGSLILGSSEGFLADEAGSPARIIDGAFVVGKNTASVAPAQLSTVDRRIGEEAAGDWRSAESAHNLGSEEQSWPSTDQMLQESRFLIDKGDLDSARRKLRTVLLRQDPSVHGHYLLGIVYEHVGALEKAAHEFEEVIRLAPEFCMGYLQSVLVYKRMGLREKAASQLQSLAHLLHERPEDEVIDKEQNLTVGFLRMTCQNLYYDLEQ